MAFLRDVSDRFWHFVSPRKTQQRRDKEFKVPVVPIRATPRKRDPTTSPRMKAMSPGSRVNSWSVQTLSPQSDIDATLLPPSPPGSVQPTEDDFEGDTLLPDTPVSQIYEKSGSPVDVWNANRDTVAVDDGKYMDTSIDVHKERVRRERQGREMRETGWPEDAIFLFQKLGMRGFEPLFPIDWIGDLETLPGDLFTAKPDKAFLRPTLGRDHHAKRALSHLFDLGGLARDAVLTRAPQRTPEFQIKRAVEEYSAWAYKDGRVDDLGVELPLFKMVTFPHNIHSAVGEKRMLAELGKLHEAWQRNLSRQSSEAGSDVVAPSTPTLYGVTASHTLMAFVTYAPRREKKEQPQVRLIAMFDFGKEGYDVWNSLAIAIFVSHCRNRMMQLKEWLPEPSRPFVADPDL